MKMRKLYIFIFWVSILPWCGQAAPGQDLPPHVSPLEFEFSHLIIIPETLADQLSGDAPGGMDFVVYDVREPGAYDNGHIKGAVNLPWESGALTTRFEEIPKDRTVILVSEEGNTALEALSFLLQKGFSDVFSIEGGMANWFYPNLLE